MNCRGLEPKENGTHADQLKNKQKKTCYNDTKVYLTDITDMLS